MLTDPLFPTPLALQQVLATYDADNNGRLEFGEFLAFMTKNTGSIQVLRD